MHSRQQSLITQPSSPLSIPTLTTDTVKAPDENHEAERERVRKKERERGREREERREQREREGKMEKERE